MNKFFTLFCAVGISVLAHGQISNDIVSTGPGYANQVWYSLNDGEQASQPKNNWDIAFDASPFGTSILINSAAGAELWVYPGSVEDFTSLDTAGINTWDQRQNADTSWAYGAFSRNQTGLFLGWGTYNTITHIVSGDRLFVIKLTSGEYRKIVIEQLASGTYTFRQAALDNSIDETHSLMKSNYSGKNFGYFDLQNQTALDREPLSSEWDLLFGQYTTFLPVPYTVAGVLHNYNTEVVQAYPVNNPEGYTDYNSHTFLSEINTIGYDWKQFTGEWAIQDSLVYFVKTASEDIWKIVFTGFGGSATGDFEFTKELMLTSSLDENGAAFEMHIYPNPASQHVNVVFDHFTSHQSHLNIHSITGTEALSQSFNASGLTSQIIDVSNLTPGVYFVTLHSENSRQTKKLIIK